MVATVWLLGCVLASGQAATRPVPPPAAARPIGWSLAPQLGRGQELVYRGTFTEKATGSQVQFQREHRLEARFFVLDAPARGLDLAALTTVQVKQPPLPGGARREPLAASVRLERLFVDLQGQARVVGGATPAVPLDGPPTLELGTFVALPRGRVATHQGWEVSEPGRPAQAWKVEGPDTANQQACVKLVGLQQSDDWDRPRADRSAWRRQDTVWIATRTGLAVKLERVIEQRAPARQEVSQRSVLSCDLATSLQYNGQMAMDRRQEVQQALALRLAAAPLLPAPAKSGKQLAALLRKINTHLETTPPTPYRAAVLQVQRHVQAASKGEVVPVTRTEAPPEPKRPAVAAIGEPAPDFLATSFTGPGSARLAQWKGKPVVLVFYHPSSPTATELLELAQKLHADFGKYAQVVGMCVHNDARAVLTQRTELKLGFPILHGGGQMASYAVEVTPKVVVIDGKGVVRAATSGWGSETADEVTRELRQWLRQ